MKKIELTPYLVILVGLLIGGLHLLEHIFHVPHEDFLFFGTIFTVLVLATFYVVALAKS